MSFFMNNRIFFKSKNFFYNNQDAGCQVTLMENRNEYSVYLLYSPWGGVYTTVGCLLDIA